MKTLKILLIIALIIVIGIGGFALKTFRDAGEFKEIKPHFSGQCRPVKGVQSSEDITIHAKTGLAFISSDDRRPLFQKRQGAQGAIFGYDLASPEPRLVNLTQAFRQEFHPHGMGLWVGKDGGVSLFVVNHRKTGHFIEIFDYSEGKLVHRDSISDPLMHSPNDVIPVDRRRFYVTNDHGNTTQLGRTLEEYLQLARSNVLYYDGRGFRVAAAELAYANGINLSPDGRTLYVAATVGGRIYAYDRDVNSGVLTRRHAVDTNTGVDNIEVDEAGNLWIGCHPKLLTFVKYSKDPNRLSPSQVIKLTPKGPASFQVTEVYLNDGKPLSGSSVAAVYKDKLLIGSVFDGSFLVCNMAQ
jgi:arylesterase/paraoxonase